LMEYNSRNQVVRRIDHGGRTGVEGKYSYDSRKTVVYSYNGDGTMASMLDRNGVTTEYSYDGFGRLIKTVAGDEVVENAYDSVGNKVTMKDKTGITIRSYDELNRTVVKSVPNAGSTIFEYDLTKVPSSVVSNNFVYTDLEQGQIAERMKDAKGNESFKVFDKNGRLLKVVDLKVETDAQNTVTRTLETTVYAYEPNGNKQSVTYDSGVKESYVYYDNNKLFTLTNFKPDGTTVIDSYEYSYDKAGNMVSKKENLGNNHSDSTTIERITTYKHDALNRLTEVDEPATVQFELVKKTTSYKYDTAGNRIGEYILEGTKLTSKIYKYNEQNRLMSIVEGDIVADTTKTTKYVYDNNGNQLYSMTEALKPVASSGTAKFGMFISGQTVDDNKASLVNTTTVNVYNEFNQLARTVVGSKTVENIYNGEGLRVVKKVDGKATNYVYIYDKIILELDDAGKQTARNLLGSNLISRTIEDGTEYNYLYNGHSDVVALIKPDGTMRMQYYYDAFGVQVHKENYVDNTANVDELITKGKLVPGEKNSLRNFK